MKRNLLIFSLVVLTLLVCIGLPIWIGPETPMYEHGRVLGLIAEWSIGFVSMVFISVFIYIGVLGVSSIWEFFDQLIERK